ncbi:uncharacterized protein LOC132706664 isoform X2 [Cylas formicarius]|uniref:uncharacterized protein LOC132706664 isoform X2 n=1 Tax=Cylas formicarius TaxID=197179 RepID=UPI002958A868|nr:uncharacterized protein LOC132706664 isoform X2 [Cylas formicarius]
MRPKYYIHFGPKDTSRVNICWKVCHLFIYIGLFIVSMGGSLAIWEILNMYKYHCILYAKVVFKTYIPRQTDAIKPTDDSVGKVSFVNDTQHEFDWNSWYARVKNRTTGKPFLEGTISMRETIFATDLMCNLMLFPPLASAVTSIFLGFWVLLSARGGSGYPGDLMANPWMCTYPFLGICAFMTILSVVCDRLFYRGLTAFCLNYKQFTKSDICCSQMDQYTRQFNLGEEKPFYFFYILGMIMIQLHTALWILQTLLYVMRILCLVDFTIYLTRIRLNDDAHKMVNYNDLDDLQVKSVVLKFVEDKEK